jgi:hypothetical protein
MSSPLLPERSIRLLVADTLVLLNDCGKASLFYDYDGPQTIIMV